MENHCVPRRLDLAFQDGPCKLPPQTRSFAGFFGVLGPRGGQRSRGDRTRVGSVRFSGARSVADDTSRTGDSG